MTYKVPTVNIVSWYPHETYMCSNGDGEMYKATFDSKPFSEGASRYVFKGTMHGKDPKKSYDCVAKVFKEEFGRKIGRWVPDILASIKAIEFAEKFNSDCIPRLSEYTPKRYKEINFLRPIITKIYDVHRSKLLWFFTLSRDESIVRREDCVVIEPFLMEEYKKFNSNGGYEDAIQHLMLAFSHWTWENSGHQFMVCDLQGVETESNFILTDPAVHSLGQKYGMTDLGERGMQMVLGNHKCNSLCRELELEEPVPDQGVFNPRKNVKNTTYSIQL